MSAQAETVQDEIVRHIDLRASQEKVWQAIADARKFGQWFRCTVEGEFVEGQLNNCRSTYPGNEGRIWQQLIKTIEPQRYFAYVWSPGDHGAHLFDEAVGHTLVEFTLDATDNGTRLTIRESGFASLPDEWRDNAFMRNTYGWNVQVENITAYVES